jgi:MFS family permease
MVLLLAIFGVGVGGEYPLSAASASEKCMSSSSSSSSSSTRNNKGQQVLLVFTMQGMGIFVNSISQSILLIIFQQFGHHVILNDGNNDFLYQYDPAKLFYIWRIIYAIGAAFLCYVLISRVIHLKESAAWAKDREEQSRSQEPPTGEVPKSSRYATTTVTDSSKAAWFLLLRHYGIRLLGTSSAWLLWDVSFYGNKLFQSTFIKALTGENSSLLQLSTAASLNAFVALLGYFAAASIIDFPSVGRVRLQLWGFALTGVLFMSCGLLYQSLSTTWLVTLYLGSSFFGQCGPNATTFLIPSEIFPTEIRTMCHGIAASSGKVGALISAILFNYLDEISLFYVSGYCSFVACAITFLTIPETVSLDLKELDRHWRSLREGEQQTYSGPATQPEFMSVYEAQECCAAEAITTKLSIPLHPFA